MIIRVFPASYGDCFTVSSSEESREQILIDTGLSQTYDHFLKPYLLDFASKKGKLNLVVVTHIDNDHIGGAVRFLEENGESKKFEIIKIEEIWHNSYRHLQFEKKEEVNLSLLQKEILREIVDRGWPKTPKSNFENNVSSRQGSSLAGLILKNQYSWNGQFDNQAVCHSGKSNYKKVGDFTFTLLSPTLEKLESLEKSWKKDLFKQGYSQVMGKESIFDDAFEFLMAREKTSKKTYEKPVSFQKGILEKLLLQPFNEDKSVTNGSSISFILEQEEKKVLFLGDSHPSVIEKNLKKFSQGKPLFFDAIKVSHHGSAGNTSPALLEMIDSDRFIISTDGKRHHHPDIVTLFRIITRPTECGRTLFFNYPTKASSLLEDADLKKRFHFQTVVCPVEQIFNIEV